MLATVRIIGFARSGSRPEPGISGSGTRVEAVGCCGNGWDSLAVFSPLGWMALFCGILGTFWWIQSTIPCSVRTRVS